jgi:hypothetical protein
MVDYRLRTTVRKSIDALRAGSTVLLAAVAHDTAVEQHNGFTFTSRHSPRQSSRGTRGRMLATSDRSRPLQKIADGRVGHHRPRDVADGRWSDGRMVESPTPPWSPAATSSMISRYDRSGWARPTYASPFPPLSSVPLAEYERHRVSLSLAASSSLRRISANHSGTPSAMIPEYIPRNSWPIAAMTFGRSAGADLLWSSSLIAIGNALCMHAHTERAAEPRFLD